jgi:DtxR family Mn-dependent transcriptional regulator
MLLTFVNKTFYKLETLATENYLKVIYHLHLANRTVSASEIALAMEVSLPTVNSMVKKLAEQKYLEYKKYKPISLTKKGIKTAALIIRKHRLTEMYLTEKMGFGWQEVHEIAEQLEHLHAPKFFDKIDEILGYPEIDPHGSPIPDKDGNIQSVHLQPLALQKVGSKHIIKAVADTSEAFLSYLNNKKIKLGNEVKIIRKESFDGQTTLLVNKRELIVSEVICNKILVEPTK